MVFLARKILAGVLLFYPLHIASQEFPSITLSSQSFEFAAQAVGSASAPQSLNISNPGNSPVDLREILVSGIDFSQSNNCSAKVAAGAQCAVQIVFKPAVSGTRLGALQLAWTGPGSPRTIPLTGMGQ